MSANITSIKSHRDFRRGAALGSRKRVFDLGEHSYSAMPGCEWRTNYWVKKIEKGKRWELYVSEENSLRTRQYSGTYTAASLREEFELVDFVLDEEEWR